MDKLTKALSRRPMGFYIHPLAKFINGIVSSTRNKTIKFPIEIDREQLGSPFDDIRAVTNPQNNKLVPLLLIVEPDAVIAAEQEERQLMGEAISNFLAQHYENGVLSFDPFDARNIDALLDAVEKTRLKRT